MADGEPTSRRPRTVTVGIGELVVSSESDTLLVTHALGSCVAVCIWDPLARVAGLLHFLLPDSTTNPGRARVQPAAFADTGIPLLFDTACQHGLARTRAVVRLIGGAEIAQAGISSLQIGRRNVLAARRMLWNIGTLIGHEVTGGGKPRSVYLSARNGQLQIKTDGEHVLIT
jgi:chemotaxis protein CheD